MTTTISAYTQHLESAAASEELAAQIRGAIAKPDALIVFLSARHNHASLLAQLSRVFPEAVLVGCSSAGEFSSGYQGEGSASAFAIQSSDMIFTASLAQEISSRPAEAARALLSGFRGFTEGRYRYRSALILNDALAGSADELVRMLNMQTGGKYKFFGGGAGDDAAFSRTFVFRGTEIATNAAVGLEILCVLSAGVRRSEGVSLRNPVMPVFDSLPR